MRHVTRLRPLRIRFLWQSVNFHSYSRAHHAPVLDINARAKKLLLRVHERLVQLTYKIAINSDAFFATPNDSV